MSQTEQLRQLQAADDPAAIRKLALDLLLTSKKREMIDAALRKLSDVDLDDRARPVLREKFAFYAENTARDSGALIREKLVRLLMDIGHPDDKDIYLRGVNTYEMQMGSDVTQNLRAAALVGLAMTDNDLSLIYATKLLAELEDTSRFNGEPATVAINLLSQQSRPLPIYQFLLLGGQEALEMGMNELVGKALESLGTHFPVELYRGLVDIFVPRDRAVVNMGIISYIVENHIFALYDEVEDIITGTRHDDLHHYGLVMLAASRDDDLVERLFRLARNSPQHRITDFIEALELVPGEEKYPTIDQLRERLA